MVFLEQLDYKSLFNYNPDTVLILDNYGIIIQVNQAFSEKFGYATDELLFKSYELIVHPDDLEEVQSSFNQVIQGTVLEFETQAFDKDERLLILSVKTIPIVIEGKVNGAFWIAKDITNHKQTIEELYKTEKKFEEIFNQTADAINIIDLHGNVLEVNPAFEIMYGWKESEILGIPLPIIPPDRLMEPQEFVHKINQNQTIKDFETTRMRKDGSYIEINLTYSPIHDLNGNLVAIAGIARDITEKKRYEEQHKFLAFHDILTGLPNRRLFIEELEQKIKEEKRYQRKIAVMYMDMDNFKNINDTFGHDVGDELLKQFAQRIKSCIRETDVIARIGGDEFTILLSEIGGQGSAAIVAEKILKSLQNPWKINNHEFITTSSIGITINRENDDEENLLKRADIALYQAKHKGKNNYQFVL